MEPIFCALHVANLPQWEVLSLGYLRQIPYRQTTFKMWYIVKIKSNCKLYHYENRVNLTDEK